MEARWLLLGLYFGILYLVVEIMLRKLSKKYKEEE